MVRIARDPTTLIQELAANNPDMQKAIEYVRQNGGDPEKAFYKLAKEQGIDPQEILNALK